jgi:hypothetical protein
MCRCFVCIDFLHLRLYERVISGLHVFVIVCVCVCVCVCVRARARAQCDNITFSCKIPTFPGKIPFFLGTVQFFPVNFQFRPMVFGRKKHALRVLHNADLCLTDCSASNLPKQTKFTEKNRREPKKTDGYRKKQRTGTEKNGQVPEKVGKLPEKAGNLPENRMYPTRNHVCM